MASTSGLTSDLTSPVSGGVSLSMSFAVQRLTEKHLSAASIAASGVRSPAMVITPEQRMPVGRLAEVSRHSPRTTFYPCQSIRGLGTQYCARYSQMEGDTHV